MKGAFLLMPLGAVAVILIGGAHQTVPADSSPMAGVSPPGKLLPPVIGAVPTQGYGCTSFVLEPPAAFCATGHFHSGIDLAAGLGTPVRAAGGGVAQVANRPTGYGLYVLMDHGGGISTLYGHLDYTPVSSGDRISAGQLIGRMGSSGMSTGPHLHFEVRRDGRPEDPTQWLPAFP